MSAREDPTVWGAEFRDALGVDPRESKCAICRRQPSNYLHRTDPERNQYIAWGKSKQIRPTWTLCEQCEHLYQAREDSVLADLMIDARVGWDLDLEEDVNKPLAAFRISDLGSLRLDP